MSKERPEYLDDPERVAVLLRAHARPNRLIAWARNTAIALLLGVSAWFAADITWQLIAPAKWLAEAETNNAPTPAPMPRQRVDLDAITNAQMFGQEQARQTEAPLPETRLSLILKGIIFTDVAEDARAIISTPDGAQAAYAIGASIAPDVEVTAITRTHVLLDNSGRRERLSLTEPGTDGAAAPVAGVPDQRIDRRADPQLARVLGRMQQRLRTDPGSLLTMMRLMPVEAGQGLAGVRVFPGPEPGVFQQFNLRPGDVLKSVNGIALDSTSRGLEVLQNLTNASELVLEVQRGEKLLWVAYSVNGS